MIRISLGKLAWLPEESSKWNLFKACMSLELLHLQLVGFGVVLFPSRLRSVLTRGYCCLIEKPQGLELIHSEVWLSSHKNSVWGLRFKKSAGNCWRQDLLQNLPARLSVLHIKEPLKMLLFLHQTGTLFFFGNTNGQDPFSDLICSLENKAVWLLKKS